MPTVTLQIRVKPRSQVSDLTQSEDGTWVARLKSPPVDGKANTELISLIAEHFGCRKDAITIKSGASGRTKLVVVDSPA